MLRWLASQQQIKAEIKRRELLLNILKQQMGL